MKNSIVIIITSAYIFLIPLRSLLTQMEFAMPFRFVFYVIPLILFVILFLIINFREKLVLKLPQVLYPLFLLIFYSIITILWSDKGAGRIFYTTVFDLITYSIIILIIYNLLRKLDIKIYTFAWLYVIGVLFVIITALTLGEAGIVERRFVFYEAYNPSWAAAYIAWGIVVSVYLYLGSKGLTKILAGFSFIVLIIFLLLTQGGNAIWSLILSFIIVLFINIFTKKKITWSNVKNIICYPIFGLLFLVFIFFIMQQIDPNIEVLKGYEELTSGELETATSGRISIIENYINVLYSFNNIIGEGILSSSSSVSPVGRTPHNVYLLIFVEYGLIGLIFWFAFIVGMLKYAIINNKNNFPMAWLAFTLILFGFGNDTLYYTYWWIGLLLFFILALDVEQKLDYKNVNN